MADETANAPVALRTYLRESTVLASASYLGSNNNIFIGWPNDRTLPIDVPPFRNIIVIESGRGGAGDIGLGRRQDRVDIKCYGVDERECKKIDRALVAYLNPESVGVRAKSGFSRSGCQINWILQEGGPNSLVDKDAANWPYTVSSWIIDYNGEPRV